MSGIEADPELARRLRDAREFEKLSIGEVAGRAGLDEATLAEIESATRPVAGPELKRLAEIYQRSIAYFLGTDTAFARARGPMGGGTAAMGGSDAQR